MAGSNTAGLRSEAPSVGSRNTELFSGWKDIARFLNKGVRTVQRYERELGLPIRRPAGKSRGSVIARKADLDAWAFASPLRIHSMPDFMPVAKRTNQLKADFLRIDSQIALTFAGIALTASDSEKRKRAALTARRAYDTIMRLTPDVDLNAVERDKLNVNVVRLKSELRSLGENF